MGIKLQESIKQDGSHHAWIFYCPGCKACHQCDERWTFNGDKEKPTFRASVLVYEVPAHPPDAPSYEGRPRCHSYVTEGRIEYLSDSTHALRGQTVDLPDWDSVRNPYG